MDGNNGVLSVSLAQMMPGLWLMAISPVFVGLYPTVLGSCLWQVVMTVGECLWSPRQLSWVASLAPNGLEGLFFAIASARCKRYAAMLLDHDDLIHLLTTIPPPSSHFNTQQLWDPSLM